jgi:hypothetical protein
MVEKSPSTIQQTYIFPKKSAICMLNECISINNFYYT